MSRSDRIGFSVIDKIVWVQTSVTRNGTGRRDSRQRVDKQRGGGWLFLRNNLPCAGKGEGVGCGMCPMMLRLQLL